MELILASTSKYRQNLLSRLKLPFRSIDPTVDESPYQETIRSPVELAKTLAAAKCRAVGKLYPEAIVVGSDQVVFCNDRCLGKPGNRKAACHQLMGMAGKRIQLSTAVAVGSPSQMTEFMVSAEMTMRFLLEDEIARYVDRDEPWDCAGSFKLESLGIALFESIETTDFTTIEGLPLIQLARVLRELGYPIP